MRLRKPIWTVSGHSPEAIRQMIIDVIVQRTLEWPEHSPKRMSQADRERREEMVKTLFQAAAGEAESR
jgi:hypothetical protein